MSGDSFQFYLDEHVAGGVARSLRRRGINVLAAHQAGMDGADDIDHLRRATAEGRIVVTQDADFLRLDAAGEPHAGIVYAPQNTSIGKIVKFLFLLIEVMSPSEMVGQVERI